MLGPGSIRSLAIALAVLASAPASALPDAPTLRGWVEGFKQSDRGPFEVIRWFCNDGSIRPARAGCRGHGDGVQHGDWNAQARALRDGGYAVANVLVALRPEQFTGPHADLDAWRQILLERFLIGVDEGWIYKGAWGYRGAMQIEDEEAAARSLTLAMLADPRWREPGRFLLLRESVRVLPLAIDVASAAQVRADALNLAARDPGFASLRAKIHSFPDAGDAERVRDFAKRRARPGLGASYDSLARSIEALYAPSGAMAAVLELAPLIGDTDLAQQLRDKSAEFKAEVNPGRRLAAAARLMRLVRDAFPKIQDPHVALVALLTSLALEREVYTASTEVLPKLDSVNRRNRLWLLAYGAEALYGAGFIGARELREVESTVGQVESRNPTLREYRDVVRYLQRVPEWSGRHLAFQFGDEVQRWQAIEPLVAQHSADRLRGSPLLFYSGVLDGMVLDTNQLAGIDQQVFGEPVGLGMRALNPGIARGVLRDGADPARAQPDGIYLLPETTSDLPPVAGILTRGEGSSLSHMSLLARNLGVPNVVVGDAVLPRLQPRFDGRAVLAVSPGGVVRLAADGPQWDAVFGAADPDTDAMIRPDMQKLDLTVTEFVPLSEVRAWDQGRICGPKGANLGELRYAFGSPPVPDGFVIPFGAFRRVLDQPLEPGGPPVFEWMKRSYDEIQAAAADPARQQQMAAQFLARLRTWLLAADVGPAFEAQLRWNLKERFGAEDGSYGVFVRSDTNVEDLKGFTGAGLNQTIPNVVGYDRILQAIREVWASPFTERAYGWRQSRMADPENVFPAVVVQRAFPSEKSGVLVTGDIETGDRHFLSVAMNEGVSGAVDGQPAEALRIDARSGEAKLLAPATTPLKNVLARGGGVAKVPASGSEVVLTADEIRQLVVLAREVPARLPSMRTPNGEAIPADIELAFKDGRLALLQIRPLNENKRAQRSVFLAQLDAPFAANADAQIWIGGRPAPLHPAETPVPAAEAPAAAPAATATAPAPAARGDAR
jgi:hypothetical protein